MARACAAWRGWLASIVGAGMMLVGCNAPAARTSPTTSSAPASSSPAASAPDPSAAPHVSMEPATVRIGVIGLVSDAGIFLAEERGYFAEQNLTLQSEQFDTAATMMPLLSSGQLDIATGGINAGLFNAIARGLPVLLTADKGSQPPGAGANVVMVRTDLAESGEIRGPRDFRGRTVGVDVPGTVNRYFWDKYLGQEGLSLADTNPQILSFPDMVGALANRRLDAALAPEPFPTLAEGNGAAVKFLTTDQIAPYSQPGVLFYSREFAERQADVGRRFMVAYLKGVRDYNRALERRDAEFDAVIEVLTRRTSLKNPAVYRQMVPFSIDPDGTLFRDSIMDMQAYFRQTGEVQEEVPWERIVDTRFIEYAVQVLGPYRR